MPTLIVILHDFINVNVHADVNCMCVCGW